MLHTKYIGSEIVRKYLHTIIICMSIV